MKTVPTGLVGVPPSGPAMPVTARPRSVPAFRRMPRAKKRRLAAFYALPPEKRSPAEAAGVRREILASGAPAECRAEAGKLTAAALRIFEARIYPSMRGPCRDMIRGLILKLADRRF